MSNDSVCVKNEIERPDQNRIKNTHYNTSLGFLVSVLLHRLRVNQISVDFLYTISDTSIYHSLGLLISSKSSCHPKALARAIHPASQSPCMKTSLLFLFPNWKPRPEYSPTRSRFSKARGVPLGTKVIREANGCTCNEVPITIRRSAALKSTGTS